MGLLIGVVTFLLIGIFHPIIIKTEYYFGSRKPMAVFGLAGIISAVLSYFAGNLISSIILGVLACCFFWSLIELKDQEERVLKGWFEENPKRAEYYKARREEFFKTGEDKTLR